MNPYQHVASNFYGDQSSRFSLDAAAVMVLAILAANYQDDMPAGANPYRWVLDQLETYVPKSNDFLRHLRTRWAHRSKSAVS